MNENQFSAKCYLSGEKDTNCNPNLHFEKRENLVAVKVLADAGDSYFNPDLAISIKINPDKDAVRYVSVNRKAEFWCEPFFSSDFSACPRDTQLLLIENENSSYTCILPVCDKEYKCVLEGDETGLYAKVFSWCGSLCSCDTLAFVYGTDKNPYTLVNRLTKFAIDIMGNYIKMREERPYPEIFEYLGWCSWDAFQIRVSEEAMLEKCKEFKDKNIPVKWAIFDDMWGDVKNFVGKKYDNRNDMFKLMHSSPLDSFKAAPERFPDGLAHCIAEMEKFGITSGIWHPTTGYWRGISPDGEIAQEHGNCLIKRTKDGIESLIPGITPLQSQEFFNSYHEYLKSCGAKFLKVDNQSVLRCWYKGILPVGKAARNMHEAIEASVNERFDGALINCMGMASENIWNRQSSPISRCSNDFLPEDRAWFTKHILQCAYNCYYQGQIIWCDWDMWWSDDSQGIKNSVVRAVSAGPIYVSDTKDRSNASIIAPLCLYDGRILRCDTPAMPSVECLTANPEEQDIAYKIFSNCEDTYIVAAFDINSDNNPVTLKVSLSDLYAVPVSEKYILSEHFTGERLILTKDTGFTYTGKLAHQDDFRLFTIAPVKDGFSFLGLSDKFIGVKTGTNITKRSFTLLECGDFEFYSEDKVRKITCNGKECKFEEQNNLYKVKLQKSKVTANVEIKY